MDSGFFVGRYFVVVLKQEIVVREPRRMYLFHPLIKQRFQFVIRLGRTDPHRRGCPGARDVALLQLRAASHPRFFPFVERNVFSRFRGEVVGRFFHIGKCVDFIEHEYHGFVGGVADFL